MLMKRENWKELGVDILVDICLLYTSDAAET